MKTPSQISLTEDNLRFTRRRYGRITFTWIDYRQGMEWVSLGDPWPYLTPKQSEIREAVAQLNSRPAAPFSPS